MLVGAWGGAFLAGAVLNWLLGLEGDGVRVAVLVAALLGGAASISDARRLQPMPPSERRDAILGWGALIGAVATGACLFLPLPWGVVAAAVVCGVTVGGLRWVSRAGEPASGRRAG